MKFVFFVGMLFLSSRSMLSEHRERVGWLERNTETIRGNEKDVTHS